MRGLRDMARQATDAALQLTLPLFDAQQRPAPGGGRRTALLQGQMIAYELRRSARRTIGFSIDDRGLTLTAPRWVSQVQIEASLQEKSRWILRKLTEWRTYEEQRSAQRLVWQHGAGVPYLGETLELCVDAQMRCGNICLQQSTLRIGPGDDAKDAQWMQRAVQAWLREQARQVLSQRLDLFAEKTGLRPARWGLSSARTRWGSCTAQGAIRLNWRLIHFPIHIIDYVVAHELAHLRELNHSARFWAIVESLHPAYRQARQWLRAYPADTTFE
jgi:predicted metal-dependent hydrolase